MDPGLNAELARAGRVRSLQRETLRKLIHFATVAAPIALWYLPRGSALVLLGAAAALALLVEWARHNLRWARYHFLRRTRRLLRHRERRRLAGATYMAIAYFAAAVLFPRPVAVGAMLFAALGDGTAALVGLRWGRHHTRWGKSWEGFGAGIVVNCAAASMIPGISIPAALIGGAAAAILEFVPLPFDDNLAVTIGGGAALLLASLSFP